MSDTPAVIGDFEGIVESGQSLEDQWFHLTRAIHSMGAYFTAGQQGTPAGSGIDQPNWELGGIRFSAYAALSGDPRVEAFQIGCNVTNPEIFEIRRNFNTDAVPNYQAVFDWDDTGVTTTMTLQPEGTAPGGRVVLACDDVEISNVGNTVGLLVGFFVSPRDPAAALEVQSITKGFLLPRMSTVQRDAIPAPPDGLMIYNNTTNSVQVRASGVWGDVP